MKFDDAQNAAIAAAVENSATIITGGAGTGKTTIIAAIARQCDDLRICALAGRAAARITEATGYDASTCHRMLGWNGSRFARGGDLYGKTVIVDEASMLTSEILYEITSRNPERLVLVGDDAQLPPVGPGLPFHDLVKIFPAQHLTKCWRSDAAVYRAAQAIRSGSLPLRHEVAGGEIWSWQDTGPADKTQEFILDMVRGGQLDFHEDLVLTFRGSDMDILCGAPALNRAIGEIMFPDRPGEGFVVGDRVINTKNDAERNIWNGTLGFVESVDPFSVALWDLDCTVECSPKTWRLGYALTTHKAQGSQFRRVVFSCLRRDVNSLDRSLLYTAVTRAREAAMVVGEPTAVAHAVSTVKSRRTVMQRIHEEMTKCQ